MEMRGSRFLGARKGMASFHFLVIVIVGLVLLALLLIIVSKIGANLEERAVESRCKNSVIAHSKLNSLPFGSATTDPGDIECPTRFITVADESPLSMKREVANMMYRCWDNYGEGRLLLFEATDKKFCAICDVFEFEDRGTRLDGFMSFLMVERVPERSREGYSPTYFDYIAGRSTDPSVVDDPSTQQLDTNYLDGSKRYAVLFTYYKTSFWHKVWNGVKGFVVGAVVTVVLAGPGIVISAISGGTATPFVVLGISAAVAGAVGATVGAAGTTAADWEAKLLLVEYSPEMIAELGCEELPISMVDAGFR